jgi:hypothetical protein
MISARKLAREVYRGRERDQEIAVVEQAALSELLGAHGSPKLQPEPKWMAVCYDGVSSTSCVVQMAALDWKPLW